MVVLGLVKLDLSSKLLLCVFVSIPKHSVYVANYRRVFFAPHFSLSWAFQSAFYVVVHYKTKLLTFQGRFH